MKKLILFYFKIVKILIIGAVCGKGPTQFIRLAAIIQVLHDAFEFVKTRYPGLQSMTKEIEQVMINERKTCSISKEKIKKEHTFYWNILIKINLSYLAFSTTAGSVQV